MGLSVLMLWAFVMSTLLFFPLRRLGILRVSTSQEMEGLDVTFHGGKALYMGTHAGTRLSTIATENGTMDSIGSMGAGYGVRSMGPMSTDTGHMRKATGNSLRGASNYQAVMSNSSIAAPRPVRSSDSGPPHAAPQFNRSTSANSRDGSSGQGKPGKPVFRAIKTDISEASAADVGFSLSPDGNDNTSRSAELNPPSPPSPPVSGNQHGAIRKAMARKPSAD